MFERARKRLRPDYEASFSSMEFRISVKAFSHPVVSTRQSLLVCRFCQSDQLAGNLSLHRVDVLFANILRVFLLSGCPMKATGCHRMCRR